MRTQYGVLGNGKAPAKVITAALDDLGTSHVEYHVPWYGKPSSALETVYDWLIDNEAKFFVIGKNVPKVLASAAVDIMESKDPDRFIMDTLRFSESMGTALIIWNDEDEETSSMIAQQSLAAGLTTVELSNGLVPIVVSPDEPVSQEDVVEEEDPTEDPSEEFDRETAETMPASVVKRLAKDKGFDAKTKEQALDALYGALVASEKQPTDEQPARRIVSVTVRYSDGMVMEL